MNKTLISFLSALVLILFLSGAWDCYQAYVRWQRAREATKAEIYMQDNPPAYAPIPSHEK